jgi:hypothetical protein
MGMRIPWRRQPQKEDATVDTAIYRVSTAASIPYVDHHESNRDGNRKKKTPP